MLASDSNSLHISGAVTVMAWVYLPTGANCSKGRTILSKDASNGGTNLNLGIYNDSCYVQFGVGTGGGYGVPIVISNETAPRDTWTHIAGT